MREDLNARLELSLSGLPRVLGRATPEQIRRRTLPEKWSAHENFAHLAHFTTVTQGRMGRILAEDSPQIQRLKPDLEPEFLALVERPPGEVLDELKRLRGEFNRQVAALTDAQLGRVGVHSAAGAMPLSEWLELFLVHESHHLYLAFWRIREAMKENP